MIQARERIDLPEALNWSGASEVSVPIFSLTEACWLNTPRLMGILCRKLACFAYRSSCSVVLKAKDAPLARQQMN